MTTESLSPTLPTHCPRCHEELERSSPYSSLCCPHPDHPPFCPKCGREETLAPGIDYYCAHCPKDLKALFASHREMFPPKPEPMAYPGVAVGVLVFKIPPPDEEVENLSDAMQTAWQKRHIRVLLGRRKGPLGTGQYSLPGGKVDFGEPPFATASREVEEETGLRINDVHFTGIVTNDWFPEQGKHFINMFYVATVENPEDLHVPDKEKEKFDKWEWLSPFELPENVWMHTAQVIRALLDPWLKTILKMPGIDG